VQQVCSIDVSISGPWLNVIRCRAYPGEFPSTITLYVRTERGTAICVLPFDEAAQEHVDASSSYDGRGSPTQGNLN